ncbi:glucosyltransferase domain-containing protein [Anaeromyxobacter sp. Fw109-5]|uniref:glucosyltransferase domain-containing protein n=1 Tax=Anaeromyxobacter sp. (strain Fw109-5) TaxID=404589 RepID=UPI0000ED6D59|nr:glucosyltransferase domain-containing protein [Anaeromyxobacter sp. Fw109-5]ABS28628.1 hypothetical protein Anae109_4450 [Anaeromyxobacter sp. Fw109-5]
MSLIRLRVPAVLALLVATCYASVLATYGFADDFTVLEAAVLRLASVKHEVIAGGRPTFAFILDASFRWAGTVERLAWLRAAGVSGIAMLACLVYLQLIRRGWSRLEAFSIALAIVAMPAFRLVAFWATGAAFPFAAVLGALSFLLAERATLSEGSRRAAAFAGAYLLLVLALSIYQPAAMFFCAMAAIAFFSPQPRTSLRLLLGAGAVFAAGALTALALARVGSAIFPVLPASRTTLSLDVPAKLLWFVRGALVDVFHYWAPGHVPKLALTVGLVVAGGCAAYLARERRSVVLGLGVASCLLIASYAPNLAAAESWSAYRTQIALGSVAVLLAAVAIKGYASLIPGRCATAVARGTLALLAACSLLAAARYTHVTLVGPAATELRWLKAELAPERVAGHDGVRVIAAHWYDHIAPEVHYDEIGIPSLARAWSARGFAASVLREAGRSDIVVDAVEPDPEPTPAPAGTLVIDGRMIRALR